MTPSKELSESLAPAEPFAERAPPRGLSREFGIGKDLKAGGDAVSQQSWLLRDPKAVIQTGPGLPTWSWRQIPLKWNGPVSKQQEMTLWLLSPGMNLVLALLRVVLLGWLIVTLM
ncbi:MAG: hypothetical protein GX443_15970 [Deltaproteobacteria bacterium]|nr:hypothetical protein [Deltaproteobacteria bacterium]